MSIYSVPVFSSQRSKCCLNGLKGLLVLVAYLYMMQHSDTVFAGNSQTVGGSSGNAFGAVLCPRGDQRVIGLTVATVKNGDKNYIKGVKALCMSMDASGRWAGRSTTTRFQNGISSFPNSSEVSVTCDDDTWVAGISGATEKYYNFSVLSRIAMRCYRSNGEGERRGNATYKEVFNGGGGARRDRYCPGEEIARGFYGKFGDYLDSVGLNCIAKRARPVPPNTFSWTKGFSDPEIRNFFGGRFRVRTLRGRDMKNVLAGSTVVRTDGNTCKSCHSGGNFDATFTTSTTRSQACNELGSSQFQNADKPVYLKKLVNDWLQRGCP